MTSGPVMSLDMRSGVNWIRLSDIWSVCESRNQECLRQTRHADKKGVAVGQNGDQDLLDSLGPPDDDLGNFRVQLAGCRTAELYGFECR